MTRLSLLALCALAAPVAAAPPDFATAVKPIFQRACVSCHGEAKQKGGLRLDRKADALKGGDAGAAILPKKAADSPLVRRVTGADPDTVMPPKGEKLSAAEVATLRAWIDAGAAWPDDGSAAADPRDWWSLRPLEGSGVRGQESGKTIDGFILAKLTEKGLKPSPEADKRTLIRRLSFDITGLPPTPEEIDAFLSDDSANAYEKLVDRLLASPRYGERWARHWLDVVHFGETHGYDKDQPRPNAWPYRDYVIRAFNSDKPYARFVQEQVAGDVLFPGTADGVEALGFLSAGPWDFIGHVELPETKIDGKVARHLDRDDFVSNTVGTFLSLTAHCAQCHNHKFDPIPQDEYYALQAVFAAIDRADRRYDADPKVAAKRAAAVAVGAVAGGAAADREVQKLPPQRVAYVGTAFAGGGNFAGTGGKPRDIRVLPRGDITKPGKAVAPGAIAALGVPFAVDPAAPEGDRRAALARWLTHTDNPLVWRSIVNRVWQYHFGRGLVDTPNDFGKMGQHPTHPELLDWLAVEFRNGGGSFKKLHKLIVMSKTYRQASSVPSSDLRVPSSADADNRYLWRQNRRKLEAEAVRDSILFAAGKLDLTAGGPSFQDFVVEKPEHSPHYQYHLHDPDDPKAHRRAVYRFTVRSKQQPFMASFDCADPSLAVEKRNQTLTPQQALALLNNKLTLAMAKHFAARVEKLSDELPGRVAAAFRLALGRDPTAAEHEELTQYATDHGLANACRVILNLNEFVFVD